VKGKQAIGETRRGSPSRRRAVLAVAVVAAVAGVVLGWRWLHARGQRAEGLELARAGRLAHAAPLHERAAARDDTDVEVVSALALAKLASPDPATAEGPLSRWCELAPDDARPYRLRMDLRQRIARGKWSTADRLRVNETAADDGRRALELDPGDDKTRRALAGLLVEVGRFAEAEPLARAALARTPADTSLLLVLAKVCRPQGKRSDAEAALDAALAARPEFAEALLLRGVLHREADRPDKAIPLLRRALVLNNDLWRDALPQLGLALAADGQADEARRVMAEHDVLTLKETAEMDHYPKTPSTRVQMAEALLRAGLPEQARERLEAVLQEAPDFAPAHRVLALYYEETGHPDRAAEHRRKSEGVRE
jgi:tetratricopeptide (TPR) repeat protein